MVGIVVVGSEEEFGGVSISTGYLWLVIGSSCILGTETEPDTTTSALAETLLP
jgi:hypothetical protein